MTQFRRVVQIQAGPPGEEGRQWDGGLRIAFDVKHARKSTENKARVSIWNLTDDSIDYLRRQDHVIRILAGYGTPVQIFAGRLKDNGFKFRDRGPERKIELSLLDGNFELKRSHLNFSFSVGTTIRQVVDKISSDIDLPVGRIDLPDGDKTLEQGISATGTPDRVLDRIAQAAGADWMIQDRELKFVESGGDTGRRVAEFSASTGSLIGSPQPKDKGRMKWKGLLRPGVRPADLVKLDHDRYGGVYRVRDVQFRGDSGWSRPFYVNLTAEPR